MTHYLPILLSLQFVRSALLSNTLFFASSNITLKNGESKTLLNPFSSSPNRLCIFYRVYFSELYIADMVIKSKPGYTCTFQLRAQP